MAGFSPGASPPPVNTPMRFTSAIKTKPTCQNIFPTASAKRRNLNTVSRPTSTIFLQSLLYVGDDVRDIFDAYRDSHQPVRDAQATTARRSNVAVRGRCRMKNAREDIAETRRAHAQSKPVHKTERSLARAILKFYRNERAIKGRTKHSLNHLLNVRSSQSWIMHARDFFVLCKTLSQ